MILDVSSLKEVQELHFFNHINPHARITINDNFLYALANETLNVIDINDPFNPQKIDEYTLPFLGQDIDISGDKIHILLREGGMIKLAPGFFN